MGSPASEHLLALVAIVAGPGASVIGTSPRRVEGRETRAERATRQKESKAFLAAWTCRCVPAEPSPVPHSPPWARLLSPAAASRHRGERLHLLCFAMLPGGVMLRLPFASLSSSLRLRTMFVRY